MTRISPLKGPPLPSLDWLAIQNVKIDVAANVNTASVTAIDVREFAAGSFLAVTDVTYTFYSCEEEGGTYYPIEDGASGGGAALSVDTSGTNKWLPIPAGAIEKVHWLKIVSSSGAITTSAVQLCRA